MQCSNCIRRLGKKSHATSLALLDYVGIIFTEFTTRAASQHLSEKLETLEADLKLIAITANTGPRTQTFDRRDLGDIVRHTVTSEIVLFCKSKLLLTEAKLHRTTAP